MSFRVPSAAELTKEQLAIFDLPADGRFLVTGPPGTGKTILALLRAQRLVNLGHRPTIVLYNKALATMVRAEAKRMNVSDRVKTYNAWVASLYRAATGSRVLPQLEPYVYDWDAIAKDGPAFFKARKTLDLEYVIVDEAQDLPADFFGFLQSLGSNLTVFADENQRITDTQSTIPDLRKALALHQELPGAHELPEHAADRRRRPALLHRALDRDPRAAEATRDEAVHGAGREHERVGSCRRHRRHG